MKDIKPLLIGIYVILAILTGIYGSIWGDYDYKGLMYNLGRGLIWPAVWFPSLGKVIGAVIIFAFVAAIALAPKSD